MKTVLITGANSGIGKATATTLAAKGYQVVFVGRNLQKAETVKQEIINATKNTAVDFVIADLRSLSQVRKCAEVFEKRYHKLDILINNAGVCLPERRITDDGFEEMFQINHLSHFLLTNLLIDCLKKSGAGRIINVSSAGYKSGKFDITNLQSEQRFGSFSTYCDTKLLNLLFTFELAKKLNGTGITVNALHPGVVNTNFAGEMRGILGLLNRLFKPFLLTPEKGAITSVYLSSSDEVNNITGKYFEKCKIVEPRNKNISVSSQEILWQKSLELTGLKV
jgi:NAD(P)-dependent dehydrogenase (short-subunit alcohol dehydrogenase family)